jgi:pyruvate/2-oxoglutarate dehydrogenase complex dihydrolipoamide dehydrogenase (E3) component
MTKKIKTDLLVIGAGAGGLSVAAGAAQLGVKVVLLEGDKMGGDCLNYGCVPSKALIGFSNRKKPEKFVEAMSFVREAIKEIEPHDSEERFCSLGVNVIREFGRFVDDKTVAAGSYEIQSRRIVIATGVHTPVPEISGLSDVQYFTNQSIFDLEQKPEHLLILGGGPVGVELAQAFTRLGIKVTIFEKQKILSNFNREQVELLRINLEHDGVNLKEEASIKNISQVGNKLAIQLKNSDKITGSHLLVATGKKPNLQNLNLQAAGINSSDIGIETDQYHRTNNKKIYAIGDVAQFENFTNVANYHAGLVIKSITTGLKTRVKKGTQPRVIYTTPEIGSVGLSKARAKRKFGNKLKISRVNFSENDRAITDNKKLGWIEIYIYRNLVVGASVIGIGAGELLNFWSFMISNRISVYKVAKTSFAYPTLGEVNKKLVTNYIGPKFFNNPGIRYVVRLLQRFLP